MSGITSTAPRPVLPKLGGRTLGRRGRRRPPGWLERLCLAFVVVGVVYAVVHLLAIANGTADPSDYFWFAWDVFWSAYNWRLYQAERDKRNGGES